MMMMMPSSPGSRSPVAESGLSDAPSFALADEDTGPLLGSYAISTSIGIAFLLLLEFGPRPEVLVEVTKTRGGIITVRTVDGAPEPSVYEALAGGRQGQSVVRRGRTGTGEAAGDIGKAFTARDGSASAMVTDPAGLLRGVAVSSQAAPGGDASKAVLATGSAGVGSVIPGRGGIAGGQGSGGIGGMGAGAGVSRAATTVTGPDVIPVDPLAGDGRSASEMGTFVRSREAELRFCYEENGLKVNPGLGGSITVALTVTGSGSVRAAEVTKRSWSGRGAAESEACILRAVRGWKLPPSDRGAAVHAFPFSFTK